MANAKISQLVELPAGSIVGNDLLIIVDSGETKKVQLSSVSTYLTTSGSLNAIYAQTAGTAATASYVEASNVNGSVPSASFANSSLTSSVVIGSVSNALTAISSSYAGTASILLGSITNAISAAYLIPGPNNGTASWANTSVLSNNSTNAYNLIYTGAPNGTASWAINTTYASNAGTSVSAGTALSCQNSINSVYTNYVLNSLMNYGILNAHVSSISESRINTMSVVNSTPISKNTAITTTGTVMFYYTGSLTGSFYLATLDQSTQIENVLDICYISVSLDAAVPRINTIPFTLQGQSPLYGNYSVYISSSTTSMSFDTNRITKFKIESLSDTVNFIA